VCTHNRSAMLAGALQSMSALELPGTLDWEILVVDNNCSDDTEAVVASFIGRLPVRRCTEPRPGLSHARNRAAAEAVGDWILWTDDDVLVDPGWLASYVEAMTRHPGAAVCGGPIEPVFAEPVPGWLREGWRSVGSAFALRDLGGEEFALDEELCPYGANYAIRRDVQHTHPYDPALGRAPGRMTGGEEVAVIRAVLRAGGSGWWVPRARVRHVIPRDRQTIRYLRRFFVAQGDVVAAQLLAGAGPRPPRMLLGRPMRWVWRWLRLEARYRALRLTVPPSVWLHALAHCSCVWGQLRSFPAVVPGGAAAGGDARPQVR